VEEGWGGLGGVVYVDARGRRKLVLVESARSVKAAVANHDASGVEYLALVLVDDLSATWGSPGDALREEVPDACRLGGGDEVVGAFGANAVVARPKVG
jgi:hypothetical protein